MASPCRSPICLQSAAASSNKAIARVGEGRPAPLPPLAIVAAYLPEPPQRPGQAQSGLSTPRVRGAELQGRSQVVVLCFQPLQPLRLLRAQKMWPGLLREAEEAVS